MTLEAERIDQPTEDPVSNVLKWILLAVAIGTFAALGWTTVLTYQAAPPFPDRFVTSGGAVLMTAADIQDGKAGFQKADLMDYGSLYGMGSYFGEDYTAAYLVRLATLTEDNIREGEWRQKPGGIDPGAAGGGQGGDAGRASRRRSDQTGRRHSRCAGRRDHRGSRRDRADPAPSRFRQGLDPGLQPRSAERRADGGFPDLFVADDGRAASRHATRPGPRIGRSSRWSATRRPPAPSGGPGSASASRSSPSAPCCSSISGI